MHTSKISQVHSYLGNFVFLVTYLVRQNLKMVLAKEISNCSSRIQEYILWGEKLSESFLNLYVAFSLQKYKVKGHHTHYDLIHSFMPLLILLHIYSYFLERRETFSLWQGAPCEQRQWCLSIWVTSLSLCYVSWDTSYRERRIIHSQKDWSRRCWEGLDFIVCGWSFKVFCFS